MKENYHISFVSNRLFDKHLRKMAGKQKTFCDRNRKRVVHLKMGSRKE